MRWYETAALSLCEPLYILSKMKKMGFGTDPYLLLILQVFIYPEYI